MSRYLDRPLGLSRCQDSRRDGVGLGFGHARRSRRPERGLGPRATRPGPGPCRDLLASLPALAPPRPRPARCVSPRESFLPTKWGPSPVVNGGEALPSLFLPPSVLSLPLVLSLPSSFNSSSRWGRPPSEPLFKNTPWVTSQFYGIVLSILKRTLANEPCRLSNLAPGRHSSASRHRGTSARLRYTG